MKASTLERFVLRVRRLTRLRAVNVLVTSSSDLRRLNREFRGVDKPTDVLSFPAIFFEGARQTRMAGELAISADIAKENAKRLQHSFSDEVKVLTLHGMLHLAGFDHEHDAGEMERRERTLRTKLKLDSGLIERTAINLGRVSARERASEKNPRRSSGNRKRRRS